MFWFFLWWFAITSHSVFSHPCNHNDKQCVTSLVQQIYDASFVGTELDPMFQRRIDASLQTLAFTLTDTTVEGFKSCKVEDASISSNGTSLKATFLCPWFKLNGQYEADGKIETLPFRGKGNYILETTTYEIKMDGKLGSTYKDGKKYLKVNEGDFYATDIHLKGVMHFRLENLFDGNKELSAAVHKFIDENQILVTELLQKPVFDANLSKIIKAFNVVFENITVDEFIIKNI